MNEKLKKKILIKFKEFGSIPLIESYINCKVEFKGVCKCGDIFNIKWNHILIGCYPLCKSCSKVLKISKISKSNRKGISKSVLERCELFGAAPLERTYINNHTPFDLICKCGVRFKLKGIDIKSGNSIPHCKICSKKLKVKQLENIWSKDIILRSIRDRCKQENAIFIEGTYKNCKTPFEFICGCGEIGNIIWSNAIKLDRRIKCKKCSDLNRILNRPRGKNHPKYDVNISDEERERNRSDVYGFGRDWAREVKRRSRFLCKISNKNSKFLVSHHLYNWWNYPQFRIFIENGVCIHRKYHDEFHKIYGKGHNTFKQFKEYFKFKTGLKFNGVDLMRRNEI